MRAYLTALTEQMSTRDAAEALGYARNSQAAFVNLCRMYGVEPPKRVNQHQSTSEPSTGLCAPSPLRETAPIPTKTTKPFIQMGIGVFDLHYPRHNKRLWNNILAFARDTAPDVFLFGGDNGDFEPVSHWIENKRRKIEGLRLKKEYDGFQADVLDPLEDILSDESRRVFMLGNHEDWVEQYIDCHPETEGFLEIANNLDLARWEVYSYSQVAKVGKLHFMHGEYINQHNAAKTVSVYHRNIVYGHGHTLQAFTETSPLDAESHTAMQIPCACDLNPHYRKDKPNAWLNGFVVFYVLPNGDFNLYPVVSLDGCFTAPNGIRYDAK